MRHPKPRQFRNSTRPAAIIFLASAMCFAVVAAQSPPATAAGDASAGKVIFESTGQCLTCHAVDERGGSLGPELSWIGILRTPESLTRSLTEPDAEISRRYFTIFLETTSGEQVKGLSLNEDDLSIQIRDAEGRLRSFVKSGLKDMRREPRSLMPSYRSALSPAELAHVVSYLRTLRTLWPIDAGERTRSIAPATENVLFLDRPNRDQEERPDLLLDALAIRAGDTVADIGAGTGYYTWRLAKRAGPSGRVYAVDVQQSMLDLTREQVGARRLENVAYVLASDNDPRLPDHSIDLAFIAYALHEFADPDAIMAAIRRALKPGGRIFILEYAKESHAAPASPLHRMSFEEIRREIEPMGFVVDRLLDFLPVQHGIVFTMK